MGNIENIVGSLESKIVKILRKIELLKRSNLELNKELERVKEENYNSKNDFLILKEKYEALKVTNSILGSDDNKRETKLKINALIRDIDHCIAQLSD